MKKTALTHSTRNRLNIQCAMINMMVKALICSVSAVASSGALFVFVLCSPASGWDGVIRRRPTEEKLAKLLLTNETFFISQGPAGSFLYTRSCANFYCFFSTRVGGADVSNQLEYSTLKYSVCGGNMSKIRQVSPETSCYPLVSRKVPQ